LVVLVLVADRGDEQAAIRLAGGNARPAVAALASAVFRVEREAALQLLGGRRVARVAGIDEGGANLLLEKRGLFGGGRVVEPGRGLGDRDRPRRRAGLLVAANRWQQGAEFRE